jgi:magnesium-transporting ATPase (P-type)
MKREPIFRGIYTAFFFIVNIFSLFNVIVSSFVNLDYLYNPRLTPSGEPYSPYGIGELLVSSLVLIVAFGVIAWYFPKLFEDNKEEAIEMAKKDALENPPEKKKRKSKSKSKYETYLLDQQDKLPEPLTLPKEQSKLVGKIKGYLKLVFINKLVTNRILWIVGVLILENFISYLFIHVIIKLFFTGLNNYWYIVAGLATIAFTVILIWVFVKYVSTLKETLLSNAIKTMGE